MPDKFITRPQAMEICRTLELDEFGALNKYRYDRDRSETPNAEGVFPGDLFSVRLNDNEIVFFQVTSVNGEHSITVRQLSQIRQTYGDGSMALCRPIRDAFANATEHRLKTKRSDNWSYVFVRAPKAYGGIGMIPCNDLQVFDYIVCP